MSETSDKVFAVSVLLPALVLLGLISVRKFAMSVEANTGQIPGNLRLFDQAPFEWMLYSASALLLTSALTGTACYAAKSGGALLGAGAGIVAALIARGAVRLPIEHDDLKTSTKVMVLAPMLFGAVGVALSLLYTPGTGIH